MGDIDKGINEDGSLREGEYEVGELPVAAWNEKDIARVAEWLSGLEIDIGNVRHLYVGRHSVSAEILHRDPNGNAHVKGHCDGSTTEVATRVADEEGSRLEAFCIGCGAVFGTIEDGQSLYDPTDNNHRTAHTVMVTRAL